MLIIREVMVVMLASVYVGIMILRLMSRWFKKEKLTEPFFVAIVVVFVGFWFFLSWIWSPFMSPSDCRILDVFLLELVSLGLALMHS